MSRDGRAAAGAKTAQKTNNNDSTYSILTDFNEFLLVGHGDGSLIAVRKEAKGREGEEEGREK